MTLKRPTLIILNGASSSGKTFAARALADVFGSNCVVTGFDTFFDEIQPYNRKEKGVTAAFRRAFGHSRFQLTDGRAHMEAALYKEALATHQSGRDVIVETTLLDTRALVAAARCFAPPNGLFVTLKPPMAIAQQWEARRDDRPLGQTRRQYERVYMHDFCDLLLDPSTLTPMACADAILARLAGPPFDAFCRVLAADKAGQLPKAYNPYAFLEQS
jgi:chloramphenicol 3-O phosphotransferase